jgi:hypothetical protein
MKNGSVHFADLTKESRVVGSIVTGHLSIKEAINQNCFLRSSVAQRPDLFFCAGKLNDASETKSHA